MQPHHRIVDLHLEDIKQGLRDQAFVIVDVREPHEFAQGHIPGSVPMPLSSFDTETLQALGQRVVFSCAAGVRSVHAIRMAQAEGLPISEHYLGGFYDWARAGEPVATGDGHSE